MGQTIGVIGAGAWGTAMAISLAKGGHKVELWAMEKDVVDGINVDRENKRFLPEFRIPEGLTASTDIKAVATGKSFLILASPSLYLARTMQGLLVV